MKFTGKEYAEHYNYSKAAFQTCEIEQIQCFLIPMIEYDVLKMQAQLNAVRDLLKEKVNKSYATLLSPPKKEQE